MVVCSNELRTALSYDDVLLVPRASSVESRRDIKLNTRISEKLELSIPLISTNMDSVTGVEMAVALGKLGGMGILPRFDSPEVQAEKISKIKGAGVVAAASLGCKEGYKATTEILVKAGADVILMDVAHGHLEKFVNATKYIAERYGDTVTIIAGVIATYDGACALFESGADAVRVGVGPGSICTTRIVTGHGVPQMTAIWDAKKAAEKYGKAIIADGGAKNSGDIVKALAAGVAAVTLGNLFAGTDEAPGEIIELNGKKYKEYNGSTSKKEKIRQIGKYSQDKNEEYVGHTEGVEALVQYKGSLLGVVEDLLAGVRSGFSYSGAKDLQELWKNAEFIQITPAGMRESNAHDVIINRSELA